MISRVLQFYTQKIKSHSIELKLNLQKKLEKFNYSETAFEQILTNLIKNSIDAHDTIDKTGKIIEIKTFKENGNIILQVIDNATGLSKENFEKILNPLFSTKVNTESMGLGLYILNNVILSNNGELQYENNNIGGVTFTIKLRKDEVL
jgi:C4-dicarboxylate-specific signal transduction histidine kinase